jgi:hypothetical protein
MWRFRIADGAPKRNNESERRKMVRPFDFIANLMKSSFPTKKEIYGAIDGDFNARIKQNNGWSTGLAEDTVSI